MLSCMKFGNGHGYPFPLEMGKGERWAITFPRIDAKTFTWLGENSQEPVLPSA